MTSRGDGRSASSASQAPGPRVLVLVGMSGVGKSFEARRLHEATGACVLDCDAGIAARLADLVTPAPGEAPVHALGRWMGLPSSPGYRAREARYLALEEEVTRAAVAEAARLPGPVVIDTTGSVVHLSEALRAALRSAGHVVYLRVPPEAHAAMLETYLREPKPVVFGDTWTSDGEGALARSYAALLRFRDARYAELAHEVRPARS